MAQLSSLVRFALRRHNVRSLSSSSPPSQSLALARRTARLPQSCAGIITSRHTLPVRAGLSSFAGAPPEDPFGSALLDLVTYEAVCSDTLESLCEYFDHLVETAPHLKYADITFSDGVLTVAFGSAHGTYVINRQSPNRQIWLSSPTTGPKRYDFVPAARSPPASSAPSASSSAAAAEASSNLLAGTWVYKHDGVTLHELLQAEIAPIVRTAVDFRGLPFGRAD